MLWTMEEISLQTLFPSFLFLSGLMIVLRYLWLIWKNGVDNGMKRSQPCRTAVVLGSGGHTSEMLKILGGLNLKNYAPRLYIIADGDQMSQNKARAFETASAAAASQEVTLKTIPRARKVMQSYFTSIFTTLAAIATSFTSVASFRPDLVLCNGPGTCIPICFWAYFLKFLGLKGTKIIYIESLCRVQKLSLSGILLYYLYIADCVYVQWPQLKKLYPRTRFIGRVL